MRTTYFQWVALGFQPCSRLSSRLWTRPQNWFAARRRVLLSIILLACRDDFGFQPALDASTRLFAACRPWGRPPGLRPTPRSAFLNPPPAPLIAARRRVGQVVNLGPIVNRPLEASSQEARLKIRPRPSRPTR